MSENEYSGSTESSKVIFSPEIPEEGKIDEFPSLNKIPEIPEIPIIGPEIPMEQTEIPKIKNPEEIDVRSVKPLEEIFPEESPEEGIAPEKKELTDEEKKEKFIPVKAIDSSNQKFIFLFDCQDFIYICQFHHLKNFLVQIITVSFNHWPLRVSRNIHIFSHFLNCLEHTDKVILVG